LAVVYLFLSLTALAHGLVCLGVLTVPKVMALWLSLAYGYWVAFTFIGLQIGMGAAVLRLPLLRDCCSSRPAFVLFAFGVGCWLSSNLLLGLGLCGLLNSWGLLLYLLIALGMASPGLPALCCMIPEEIERVPGHDPLIQPRWLPRAGSLLIAFWVIPYFLQTLLPNTAWAGDVYHLPLARHFLDATPWATVPGLSHLDYPGSIHLFYSVFLFVGAESAITPFSFVVGVAILPAIFALCRQFWGRTAAWWAVLACVGANGLWEVAMSPLIDATQAFFYLLACFAVLTWVQDRARSGCLPVAGMMLGVALGTKYTSAAFPVILLPVVLVAAAVRRPAGMPRIWAPLLWAIVLTCVPSLFWYARNWQALGDSMYPYLKQQLVFQDDGGRRKPLDDALLPMMDDSALAGGKADDTLRDSPFAFLCEGYPREQHHLRNMLNLWDVVTNPSDYARTQGQAFPWPLLLFFLLPICCRDRMGVVLFVVGSMSYLPLAAKGYLSRYLLPVEPLFAIGAGIVLQRSLKWARSYSGPLGRAGTFLLLGLLAWIPVDNWRFEWAKLRAYQPLAYLRGDEDHLDFLCRVGYNRRDKGGPLAVRYLNQEVERGALDEQATVFMFGESKGYLLHCRYLPDHHFFEGHPWMAELVQCGGDYEQMAQRFQRRHITHILFNTSYLQWSIEFYGLSEDRLRRLRWVAYHLVRFLARHADIVYKEQSVYIAKLK
jgi:4-amino-4-deoxy-L-arabinose transferase-like glycosyltransferase